MKMKDIKELDHQYITGTYNRFPVTITWGSNDIAYDENGKEYIDLESGYGTNSFGFCDPDWINAVEEQLHKVQHTSNLYYTEPCAKLAELLARCTGMANMFFTNSGGEANECALKAARRYQHLHKGSDCYEIVSMKNSFHGRSYGALSATGNPHYHEGFEPLVPGFKYAEFNNPENVESLVDANRTAAIIVECVQGEGGVNVMTQEFADTLTKLCREKDVLLICDEVQTGNGRTGTLYSYEHLGLRPDIVTTAKGVGGGLPIGICMFSEKTKNALVPGTHGTTFGGNPIACAGALSIVERLNEGFLDSVKRKSAMIFEAFRDAPGVAAVEGLGLMIAITPASKKASDIVNECLENGVLCITAGPAGEKVRLLPPLTVTEEHLKQTLKVLLRAFAK